MRASAAAHRAGRHDDREEERNPDHVGDAPVAAPDEEAEGDEADDEDCDPDGRQ
jgi:hypothetical protein